MSSQDVEVSSSQPPVSFSEEVDCSPTKPVGLVVPSSQAPLTTSIELLVRGLHSPDSPQDDSKGANSSSSPQIRTAPPPLRNCSCVNQPKVSQQYQFQEAESGEINNINEKTNCVRQEENEPLCSQREKANSMEQLRRDFPVQKAQSAGEFLSTETALDKESKAAGNGLSPAPSSSPFSSPHHHHKDSTASPTTTPHSQVNAQHAPHLLHSHSHSTSHPPTHSSLLSRTLPCAQTHSGRRQHLQESSGSFSGITPGSSENVLEAVRKQNHLSFLPHPLTHSQSHKHNQSHPHPSSHSHSPLRSLSYHPGDRLNLEVAGGYCSSPKVPYPTLESPSTMKYRGKEFGRVKGEESSADSVDIRHFIRLCHMMTEEVMVVDVTYLNEVQLKRILKRACGYQGQNEVIGVQEKDFGPVYPLSLLRRAPFSFQGIAPLRLAFALPVPSDGTIPLKPRRRKRAKAQVPNTIALPLPLRMFPDIPIHKVHSSGTYYTQMCQALVASLFYYGYVYITVDEKMQKIMNDAFAMAEEFYQLSCYEKDKATYIRPTNVPQVFGYAHCLRRDVFHLHHCHTLQGSQPSRLCCGPFQSSSSPLSPSSTAHQVVDGVPYPFPLYPLEFRRSICTYYKHITNQGKLLLRMIEHGLGLRRHTLTSLLPGKKQNRMEPWVYETCLRIYKYHKNYAPTKIICPEHYDHSLLTLTPSIHLDPELEVCRRADGQWISAEHNTSPAHIIVLPGSQLAKVLGGFFHPTIHRVVWKTETKRTSMALYLRATGNAKLNPQCMVKSNVAADYYSLSRGLTTWEFMEQGQAVSQSVSSFPSIM